MMVTVSLCMIVKNEERVLARCLDSFKDLVDEMIIVDTGSQDGTKEIARRYTGKVYDFEWGCDFSAARNFAFSKAGMDYIYSADADEFLEGQNRALFLLMKQALLTEIEIVQMKYVTKNEFNTVLNSTKEYRPKLFKRLRTFTWVDPVHETVRLEPVVYDSDIEVTHLPQSFHSKRDFRIIADKFREDGRLSSKLRNMYARELLKTGDFSDFKQAEPVFRQIYEDDGSVKARTEAGCVLARFYRMDGNWKEFFKIVLKGQEEYFCSEMACELGDYFFSMDDYGEAAVWYRKAVDETESILDVHACGDLPLAGLVKCCERLREKAEKMGDALLASEYGAESGKYKKALADWTVPEEI